MDHRVPSVERLNNAIAGAAMSAALAALCVPARLPAAQSSADDGPRATPPILVSGDPNSIHGCYPAAALDRAREGRLTVIVEVQTDGTVSDVEYPPGTEQWQQDAARCIVSRMKFRPGTVNGEPVVSRATLPIQFMLGNLSGRALLQDAAQFRSSPSQLEAAYRACYPPASTGEQSSVYKFTIGVDGRARNVALVESGGDPTLDQAGRCILRRLEFQPLLRGSQAVKSMVSMPLHVRPPAAAE
ncbi:MAG TPA: TonB family protein [Steroidobacteraceae bacterium]|nr:TonB family protein [Steroidobacteraceae bacterium]